MSPAGVALIAAFLGLGAVLQSAVGFGMGLLAVPLLVWAGHPLPVAVALLIGGAFVQTAYGSYVTRQHIRWRLALPFAGLQWLGLVGGVACMGLLVEADPIAVKQVVGAAVVIVLTLHLVLRPAPRQGLVVFWMILAATTGGFLGGLVGMGGPPLVFFALAQAWSRDDFRAFLWSQFLLALPIIAAALAFRFGPHLLVWMGLGAALAPVLWLGSKLGFRLTTRWDQNQLHVASVLVLYAIGITSILGPYLP